MNLRLSLKRQWFELTDCGEKKEDYREITPYWAKRLFFYQGELLKNNLDDLEIELICEDLNNANNCLGELNEEISYVVDNWSLSFKPFTTTTITLGYPKDGDSERTRRYLHAGIEIRTGKPKWGAEPDKLYFVIKHGNKL